MQPSADGSRFAATTIQAGMAAMVAAGRGDITTAAKILDDAIAECETTTDQAVLRQLRDQITES